MVARSIPPAIASSGETFFGPFKFTTFVVLPPGQAGKRHVAVAAIHHLYWPSAVSILDDRGQLLRQYWHGGHVHVLAVQGRRLLAGGVRNGTNEATVAALDPETIDGASAEDEKHQLIGLAKASELARFTFPRSCLNKKVAVLSRVNVIQVTENQVNVHTLERTEGSYPVRVWGFTPSLQFQSVTESGLYTKEKAEADASCLRKENLAPTRLGAR